ncbi:S41 family peptidase [Candidatus Babeliales bacterium]|nr:S41 family peptidase [Candidatus Babeliales bacterium]MCF7899454.1 S41 family peptidase [Candidatus Babeliales bacterium]
MSLLKIKKFYLLIITSLILAQALAQDPIEKKPQLLLAEKEPDKKTVKQKATTDPEKDIYQWLRTVSEVVTLVEKKAYRETDFSNFVQESLKAAVPHVDAHSAFFSNESYKATLESTSGEFSGIGVSIIGKTPDDDALVIVDVIHGGPAQKGGLKPGDKIIEVEGDKLRGLSTDEVITKLKGKVGTEVNLKIIRDKKPLEFKIKREIIKDQNSICYHIKDHDIYYLSLKLFTQTASKQVEDLLKKANKGQCNGIILDLRRNPGGILDSVVDMAGLFIDKKSLVVSTKSRSGKVVAKYYTSTEPVLKSDLPIFILIDNFTASASEILAGCLKYYSNKGFKSTDNKKPRNLMAFLVGTSTFGKGSVQEVIPISNGCALKLTTMLYYLPSQKSIQAIGIKPDFLVKPKITPAEEIKWIKELYGKETSLKHYIIPKEIKKDDINKDKDKDKQAKSKEETEKSWEEKHQEAINQDEQIKTCINLINMLNFAKKCNPNLVDTRKKALRFLKQNYVTDQEVKLEKLK